MQFRQASRPWCRSCGSDLLSSAEPCSSCGMPLVAPSPGPARVGTVLEIGRALFKKPGVVVAESAEGVSVIVKGEERTELSLAEFDSASKITLEGPQPLSAAGRLWQAVLAGVERRISSKWSVQLVDNTAWEIGRTDLGVCRASVLDRLALGLECDVSYLPVSESEMAWYRAYAASTRGEDRAMLDALLALPPIGYAARIDLILQRSAALLTAPELHADVVQVLEPLATVDADARALAQAFADQDAPLDQELIVEFAVRTGERAQVAAPVLAGVAEAIARLERIPALPPSSMPYLETLDVYLAGRAGADLDQSLDLVSKLPLECVDELIDAGALQALPDDANLWTGAMGSYLECRIQPASASVATLREAGFAGELARRAFLRRDRAAIDELGHDAEVAHYRALLELVENPGRGELPSDLRPDSVNLLSRTQEVAAAGNAGPTLVPLDVLRDLSLWPMLRTAAEQGNLQPEAPRHELAGAFQVWSELCGLQRKLFDGRWQEVVSTGTELARNAPNAAAAGEALNMAAYACVQLGQPDDAMKLLTKSIQGEASIGLLVNAAVLASDRGSKEAISYLARAVALTTDPEVAQAAIRQALQLWYDDPREQTYPPDLAGLIRQSLVAQLEDDFFLELVLVSCYSDRDWFATQTSVRAGSKNQRSMYRYFYARSRAFSDRVEDTPKQFFAVLADLLSAGENQPWLVRERDKCVGMLFEGVMSEDFGKGWPTALCIAEMIKRDCLSIYERLVLAPQAGAHLAGFAVEDGREPSPESEQALLLDSITLYRSRRSELSESQDDLVLENLVRCLVFNAAVFLDVAAAQNSLVANEYNELNDRMRWDVQNRHVIARKQRQLLDSYDPYLARGRVLVASLDGFELEADQRSLRRSLADSIAQWSDENSRLRGRY